MAIRRVGVVGCGLMGSGIAQVSAAAGFETVVREVNAELVEKGIKSIEKNLNRLAEKGTITDAVKGEIRSRLKGTTSIEDLKNCDVIVEAIIEQLPAKRELFGALDKVCPPATIFASNTSSLTITEIATATKRPQRFVGLHFFNPVPVMKLVEVVRTIATEPAVYEEMVAFGAKLHREPAAGAVSSGRHPRVGRGRRFHRGHRQFHEAGLRTPDGAADTAGFCGTRYDLLHFADYV